MCFSHSQLALLKAIKINQQLSYYINDVSSYILFTSLLQWFRIIIHSFNCLQEGHSHNKEPILWFWGPALALTYGYSHAQKVPTGIHTSKGGSYTDGKTSKAWQKIPKDTCMLIVNSSATLSWQRTQKKKKKKKEGEGGIFKCFMETLIFVTFLYHVCNYLEVQ